MTIIRKRQLNKKGSYLIEAAITLPVFIIAVVVMISIILMYACIEDCNFAAASEIRRSAAESVYADTPLLLSHRLCKDIEDDHSRVKSARVTDFGYRVSRWGFDELIAITVNTALESPNPIGIGARANYDISLVTRAYVGKIRNIAPMSEGEMSGGDSVPVFIFPKRGERYHNRGCGVLRAAKTSGTLTRSLKSKYKPCPICGSRKAKYGSLVYYFPAAGESYHLPGCASLQRNYIEVDKKDAVSRGYTPCSKCGG